MHGLQGGPTEAEVAASLEKFEDGLKQVKTAFADKAAVPPCDRSQRTLTDGSPVTEDHTDLKPNGQQKGYVVLSAEERAKGFVRPVRQVYVHRTPKGCGTLTRMSLEIAETYARDPKFYSGTFCVGCGTHLPLNEFVWDKTNEELGS